MDFIIQASYETKHRKSNVLNKPYLRISNFKYFYIDFSKDSIKVEFE